MEPADKPKTQPKLWPTSPRPSIEEILRAVRITSLTRELDLSYARGLTPSNFKSLLMCLPNLRKLVMRHTDIGRLPDAFVYVPELRELDVSNNELKHLPASLGHLSKLQHLTATGNKIEALPQSLGRLHALRFLNVSSNRIVALGPEIRFCKSLRVLRLASNRLAELNPGVGELTQLQLLQLSFNRLRRLPEELGGALGLRVLNVAFNALSAMPQSLEALTELAHLDVTGNDITSMPVCFARLDTLRVRGLEHPTWRISGQSTQVTASPFERHGSLWSGESAPRTREIDLSPSRAARSVIGGIKRAWDEVTGEHRHGKLDPQDKTRLHGPMYQGQLDAEQDAPTRLSVAHAEKTLQKQQAKTRGPR